MKKIHYDSLALNILNDRKIYQELDQNPFNFALEEITSELMKLFDSRDISKRLLNCILPKNTNNLGTFRLLFKIHKDKFGLRQIISYKNHLTSYLCILIESILKPFIREFDTFILDSQNLMQKVMHLEFPSNSILLSADITSLYTSIDHEDCLYRCTEFLREKSFFSEHLSISGFNKILKLVLKFNLFKFKSIYYKQVSGIAMGSKCGPSIANVYVHTFERSWIFLYRPFLFFRFIDDIFAIVRDEKLIPILKSSFGNLSLTVNFGKSVQYLDLNISLDNFTSRLNFSVFFKKTNTFSYLLSSSNHPKFIFKNIPKSLFIRIRRNCTFLNDFIYFSQIIINQLLTRGYLLKDLNKAFNMVLRLDRIQLLSYKEKKDLDLNEKIFFRNIYERNTKNINQILKKSFDETIKLNDSTKNLNICVINKMQPNLISLLVHDFSFPIVSKNNYRRCNLGSCLTCQYSNNSYFIQLSKSFFLPIFDNTSCDSKNCIYVIFCSMCNAFYVGQTINIKDRMANHRSKIKNFTPFKDPFCCVAVHFNLKFHSFNTFSFFILRQNLDVLETRLNVEVFFINLFKIHNVFLINDYIPQIKDIRNNFHD